MKKNLFRFRLAQLRSEKGLTQADLARELNVDSSTIGNYETGLRFPRPSQLIAICDYFGVSVDYIMGRTDIPHMAQFEIAVRGLPVELQELLFENEALPVMEFVADYLEAGVPLDDLRGFLTYISKIRQKIQELPPEK